MEYKVTVKMKSSVEITVNAENKEEAEEKALEILNDSEEKRAEILDFNNAELETKINPTIRNTGV